MPVSTRSVQAAGNQAARTKQYGTASERKSWKLRLYVIDETPKSIAAYDNLRRVCEKYLPGRYEIEIVDLGRNPQMARDDQILSIPTLVRKLPPSHKKIVGDLSNTNRVLECLDLQPAG